MNTSSYEEGDVIILIKKDKAGELKKVLQDLTELHERLTKIVVRDCEVHINEHGGNGRYTLDDCVNIVKQIKGVYYPPSGKYYEFSDGSTCEDWNLEFHIKDKLVDFDQVKEEVKNERD